MLESTVCQIIRSAFSEDGSLKLPEGLEPSVVYAELQAQAIPGFALLPGGLLDACADNALAAAWLNHDLGCRALFGHLLNVQDEMLSVLEANGIPRGAPGLKALFQEALGRAEAACVQGHGFPVFPPMVNGVVLLLHAPLRPFAWAYQAGRCVRVVLARKDIAGGVRFDMEETARRRNLGSEMGLYDR